MCYAQLSPLYLLSTLHITHVDKLFQALYRCSHASVGLAQARPNYSRPSTAFLYCNRRKAGQGVGTRL